MNIKKHLVVLFSITLMSLNLFADESSALDGIAVIDGQRAILDTEVAKQAYEELLNSKPWKEAEEDFKLKEKELNVIIKRFEKEGPTMSDEEKLEDQKRAQSLGQDRQFLLQKLQKMEKDTLIFQQNEQTPAFQKVVSELIRATGIKLLLHKTSVMAFDEADPSLNLTPVVTELLNLQEKEKE